MVKLNLQLFAKAVTNEIVQAVIRGNYGNGEARKTALTKAGYNYSEVQSAVNAALKGNSSSSSNNSNKGTNNSNGTNTASDLYGVDKSLTDKVENNPFTESDDTLQRKEEADDSYNALKDHVDTPIVDDWVYETLKTPFTNSESYNNAMAMLQSQAAALQSGRTSWTDDIEDMFDKIKNRDKFEYDVDNDQLFQQALASAMKSGQTAMQDTIGQASALTGGYGSTYATSAGNQAYNAFIEDAYNNLPEYYQMALQAYQAEGDEMFNLLNMYMNADNSEWGKMVDAFNTTSSLAQQYWNEDVTKYEAAQSQAYNYGSLQSSEWNAKTSALTGLNSAAQSRYEQSYTEDWNSWSAEIDNAFKMIELYNSDAWNQRTYDQTEKWNQKDLDYKNASLAEDKRQFNYSIGDTNNDGVVSDAEKAAMNEQNTEYKTPTQSQKEAALKAYNEGGEDAYYAYLDSLPSNVDVEEIDLYVNGNDSEKGYGELPHSQRTYTVIADGGNNWLWGIDNNAKVKDQYGNVFTLKQLAEYDKDIAKELSKSEYTVGKTYTKK